MKLNSSANQNISEILSFNSDCLHCYSDNIFFSDKAYMKYFCNGKIIQKDILLSWCPGVIFKCTVNVLP